MITISMQSQQSPVLRVDRLYNTRSVGVDGWYAECKEEDLSAVKKSLADHDIPFYIPRDADGLDEGGQRLWARYQAEEGKPAEEEEEEFGTPNAAYCNSSEQDHNGGWFCYHPSCAIEDYQAGLAFILDGQESF